LSTDALGPVHTARNCGSCRRSRRQPTRWTSWKLVGNPGCEPVLATSFQLVRLVGCSLQWTRAVCTEP